MPRIMQQLIQLQNGSVFVVYSITDPCKHRKSCLFHKSLRASSFVIQGKVLSHWLGGQLKTIDLSLHFNEGEEEANNNQNPSLNFADFRV